MAEWVDYPAEVVELSTEVVLNFPIGDMPTVINVVTLESLPEVIINDGIYPIVTEVVEYETLLLDITADINTLGPALNIIELDFNTKPVLEGIEFLPIVIIPLGCIDKPFQYWG